MVTHQRLAMFSSVRSAVSSHNVAFRPSTVVSKRRTHIVRAESNPSDQAIKQTVGGGGYEGSCSIEAVKAAIKECDGLEGAALEACWADTGCDLKEVTHHYKSLAKDSLEGLPPASQVEQAFKQTVAGGGFSGVCNIEKVKKSMKECAGLEGAALKACWADSGCDIDAVTEHYLSVAGLSKDEYNCFVTHDGHLVCDGLKSGKYNVSAWWSGVQPNANQGKDSSPTSAPACTASNQVDCTLIITQVEPSELVCPGLDIGVYNVTNIRDFGDENCTMGADGSITCEVPDWGDDQA